MKKMFCILVSSLALAADAFALEGWTDDFPAAQARARKESKPLLLDFTGSDWCAGCIRMRKGILEKKEFADFASTNLVLVEVDFPEKKAQSDALKKQNEELEKRYKVGGYPAFVLVDAEGKELGRFEGMFDGGPAGFIAKIQEWKKAKAK